MTWEHKGSPRLPRARGDRPLTTRPIPSPNVASPRARGSTVPVVAVALSERGFPARAGIDPVPNRSACFPPWLPRARGDRPGTSPLSPAPALASPRARGSTPDEAAVLQKVIGFPARAGIDPGTRRIISGCSGLPRARGDRPLSGHGPRLAQEASPRARGSTQSRPCGRKSIGGFPARAGIDLLPLPLPHPHLRLPRARGDRPCGQTCDSVRFGASPRARGSTRDARNMSSSRFRHCLDAGGGPNPTDHGSHGMGK